MNGSDSQRRAVRFGVVGIGEYVTSTTAPAMVADPACELVAVVSRDQGRADAFASRFGAQLATTEYHEMLERDDIDAVFIATPNALHAEQTIAAAQAGKHVLCDKPIATSPEHALVAVNACRDAGVFLGVNFHNRYLTWANDVRDLIREGAIGSIDVVEFDVGPGTRVYENWRSDPALAGFGSLYNVGVHVLDLVGYLLDADPIEVMTMLDRPAGSREVESLAMILIRFSNGTLAYANCNERVANPRNDITIYGSSGRICGDNLTRSRVDGTLRIMVGDDETVIDYPAPHVHEMCLSGFAQAVLAGRSPQPSGLDGLRSMYLCDAIIKSHDERRLVEVSLPQADVPASAQP
jgi:1,5-anhydro-D-fructose reductase (1,5-anhydro-D-mannitol-forming)